MKMSENIPNHSGEKCFWYGKHHSPETIEKIKKSMIGNKNHSKKAKKEG
jgi:hypothetical protein